jgi:hypothetical protein
MESIFLILSGVILAAGILYWFWSHIQLTQKKVQLLENAVFELRGMLTGSGQAPSQPSPLPENEEAVYNDLADDDWEQGQGQEQDEKGPSQNLTVEPLGSTPLDVLNGEENTDLQPGGRAEVDTKEDENQFREMFVQHDRRLPTPTQTSSQPVVTTESLEAMPVRELRRLAEQRGLTGVGDLKKKELLSALRQQITSAPQGQNVVVERTLDLTESAEEVTETNEVNATVLE